MSVMSVTFGYRELCGMSHEFVRRGCSYTPTKQSWAGDLLITEESLLKQSEVNDIRGEESNVREPFSPPTDECSAVATGIPTKYKVEETDLRDANVGTFSFTIKKSDNEEDEKNWDLDVYQSTDDCGVLMDGGDALQIPGVDHNVTSLCGTIHRTSPASPVQAHYLDNRKSYSTDPDNGLLVCIRTGAVWNWEIRYSPADRILLQGLSASDDVSVAFTEALSVLGMTHEDVFEFGMI